MKKYFIHFTQYYNYLVLINYKLFILEIKYIYLIKCIIKKFNSLSNHKIELFRSLIPKYAPDLLRNVGMAIDFDRPSTTRGLIWANLALPEVSKCWLAV